MLKMLGGAAAALVIMALPAAAQTTAPNPSGQNAAPTSPNSGAGIPGKPGNKSGPSVKPSPGAGGTTGSSAQDPSNIPGKPGSKSGPTQKPPAAK